MECEIACARNRQHALTLLRVSQRDFRFECTALHDDEWRFDNLLTELY